MTFPIFLGEILPLLKRNFDLNEKAVSKCDYKVTELDFFWEEFPAEIEQCSHQCDIILAADVVYDKSITIHFFKTLQTLLSLSPKTAYIAIEKRQHAGNEGEIIAPNYEIFLQELSFLNGTVLNNKLKVSVVSIAPNFKQYFKYSRVAELNLFQITSEFNQ